MRYDVKCGISLWCLTILTLCKCSNDLLDLANVIKEKKKYIEVEGWKFVRDICMQKLLRAWFKEKWTCDDHSNFLSRKKCFRTIFPIFVSLFILNNRWNIWGYIWKWDSKSSCINLDSIWTTHIKWQLGPISNKPKKQLIKCQFELNPKFKDPNKTQPYRFRIQRSPKPKRLGQF